MLGLLKLLLLLLVFIIFFAPQIYVEIMYCAPCFADNLCAIVKLLKISKYNCKFFKQI